MSKKCRGELHVVSGELRVVSVGCRKIHNISPYLLFPIPSLCALLFALCTLLFVLDDAAVAQQIPRVGGTGTRVTQQTTEDSGSRLRTSDSGLQEDTSNVNSEARSPKPEVPPESDISRALELYQRGDFGAAKTMLEDICKKDPKLPPPGIFLVQFAAASQQEERIRYWLDEAAWNHPDDPEAFSLLAEFALNDGRIAEAKLLVEKAVALLRSLANNENRRKSIEASANSVQGKLYQTRGDWSKARSYFEKLIENDPDNLDILARLGFVATHQGKYDEAIAFYQKAVDQGAKIPVPKLIVSQIADQLGKTEIADKYFNEVVKTTDIDPESIRIAVQIQLRRGNISEAEKFLQQAIKAEPNNPDNLAIAGTIDLFKKNWSAAEKRFQDAILINPDSYAAAQGLALALVEQDDALKKDRALTYAKINVQRSGETPDSVATLAWVFFKSGKQIEAEFLVNRVMQTGELTPLSAYYFAEITAKSGQTDKAVLFAKIATGSGVGFMKKAEAEALLKRLESAENKTTTPPTTATEIKTEPEQTTATEKTPAPIRIPGTRN